MPRYVIERQYLLPVYEHLLIEAPSLEAACREAVDEIAHPWSENAEQDFDNARAITITEAIRLPDNVYPELRANDGGSRQPWKYPVPLGSRCSSDSHRIHRGAGRGRYGWLLVNRSAASPRPPLHLWVGEAEGVALGEGGDLFEAFAEIEFEGLPIGPAEMRQAQGVGHL